MSTVLKVITITCSRHPCHSNIIITCFIIILPKLARSLLLFNLHVASFVSNYRENNFFGPRPVSFVERSIILCPYLGGSTIGGSTVYYYYYTT